MVLTNIYVHSLVVKIGANLTIPGQGIAMGAAVIAHFPSFLRTIFNNRDNHNGKVPYALGLKFQVNMYFLENGKRQRRDREGCAIYSFSLTFLAQRKSDERPAR